MVSRCDPYGFTLRSIWFHVVIHMVSRCDSYGFTLGFVWYHVEIHMIYVKICMVSL